MSIRKKKVPKMIGFMAYVRKPVVAKLDKLIKEQGLESRAQVVRNIITDWVESQPEVVNEAG